MSSGLSGKNGEERNEPLSNFVCCKTGFKTFHISLFSCGARISL